MADERFLELGVGCSCENSGDFVLAFVVGVFAAERREERFGVVTRNDMIGK